MHEHEEGITINGRLVSIPLHVAVVHVKLMFSVIKRPVSLSVDYYYGNAVLPAAFLVSLHAESRDSPVAEVKYLNVELMDNILSLNDRLYGNVVEPLRQLENLYVEDLPPDKALNSIGADNLKKLYCGWRCRVSLLPIRGMQSPRKVYVYGLAEITDRDIEVLSELRQLRALTIESCQNVTRLAPFKDHRSL